MELPLQEENSSGQFSVLYSWVRPRVHAGEVEREQTDGGLVVPSRGSVNEVGSKLISLSGPS